MKMKVFNKPKSEDIIYLNLEEDKHGEICVVVVDENGNKRPSGNLLSIKREGIFLECDVSKTFGFDLTPGGRLKVLNKTS